jgi:arylsulfatase A
LPALLGKSETGRASLVEYDQRKERALRAGDWKYVLPGETDDGLGPWTDVQVSTPGFLFNLANDPGETNNLAKEHPEKVAIMAAQLSAITNQSPDRVEESIAPTGSED